MPKVVVKVVDKVGPPYILYSTFITGCGFVLFSFTIIIWVHSEPISWVHSDLGSLLKPKEVEYIAKNNSCTEAKLSIMLFR